MNNQVRKTHVATNSYYGWIELHSYKEIPRYKLRTIRANAYGK